MHEKYLDKCNRSLNAGCYELMRDKFSSKNILGNFPTEKRGRKTYQATELLRFQTASRKPGLCGEFHGTSGQYFTSLCSSCPCFSRVWKECTRPGQSSVRLHWRSVVTAADIGAPKLHSSIFTGNSLHSCMGPAHFGSLIEQFPGFQHLSPHKAMGASFAIGQLVLITTGSLTYRNFGLYTIGLSFPPSPSLYPSRFSLALVNVTQWFWTLGAHWNHPESWNTAWDTRPRDSDLSASAGASKGALTWSQAQEASLSEPCGSQSVVPGQQRQNHLETC